MSADIGRYGALPLTEVLVALALVVSGVLLSSWHRPCHGTMITLFQYGPALGAGALAIRLR